MLESAISKWVKKISAVFPLALRVDDIAMYSHHAFWFGGCFVSFYFVNNLSLSQHGKDSSQPESQHWSALTCPHYSLLTISPVPSLLPSPPPVPPPPPPPSLSPVQLWSLASLRKLDNSDKESNWCLLYFFLGFCWGLSFFSLFGEEILPSICVFSSRIHVRTRFYHVFVRHLCIAI